MDVMFGWRWMRDLMGVNMLGGFSLDNANLAAADLQKARNLTQEQLNAANRDDRTQLPEGLTWPGRWSRSEGNEKQSGAAGSTTGQ